MNAANTPDPVENFLREKRSCYRLLISGPTEAGKSAELRRLPKDVQKIFGLAPIEVRICALPSETIQQLLRTTASKVEDIVLLHSTKDFLEISVDDIKSLATFIAETVSKILGFPFSLPSRTNSHDPDPQEAEYRALHQKVQSILAPVARSNAAPHRQMVAIMIDDIHLLQDFSASQTLQHFANLFSANNIIIALTTRDTYLKPGDTSTHTAPHYFHYQPCVRRKPEDTDCTEETVHDNDLAFEYARVFKRLRSQLLPWPLCFFAKRRASELAGSHHTNSDRERLWHCVLIKSARRLRIIQFFAAAALAATAVTVYPTIKSRQAELSPEVLEAIDVEYNDELSLAQNELEQKQNHDALVQHARASITNALKELAESTKAIQDEIEAHKQRNGESDLLQFWSSLHEAASKDASSSTTSVIDRWIHEHPRLKPFGLKTDERRILADWGNELLGEQIANANRTSRSADHSLGKMLDDRIIPAAYDAAVSLAGIIKISKACQIQADNNQLRNLCPNECTRSQDPPPPKHETTSRRDDCSSAIKSHNNRLHETKPTLRKADNTFHFSNTNSSFDLKNARDEAERHREGKRADALQKAQSAARRDAFLLALCLGSIMVVWTFAVRSLDIHWLKRLGRYFKPVKSADG